MVEDLARVIGVARELEHELVLGAGDALAAQRPTRRALPYEAAHVVAELVGRSARDMDPLLVAIGRRQRSRVEIEDLHEPKVWSVRKGSRCQNARFIHRSRMAVA